MSFDILTDAGGNPGVPDFLFPNAEKDITAATAFYAAFTPTGTSVTLTSATEGIITPSGCTLRESYNTKPHLGSTVLFAATARRKPGTTGSIAAQTVVFSVNSVQIGRLTVPAAAAGIDPVCGYTTYYHSTGDTRTDLSTYALAVSVTAADPDLEIVVWMIGNQD